MAGFGERVLKLTRELVRIASTSAAGQREIAAFALSYLAEFPYFQEHPANLEILRAGEDEGELHSVLALYEGDGSTEEALLLCGHLDTVGVEKFMAFPGADKELPFDPGRLPDALTQAFPDDEELKADLASGEWMCGRGAFDMKGGCAVAVELLRLLIDAQFPWKVALLLTADEEVESRGVKSALPRLSALAAAGWRFRLADCLDYTSPLYPGDGSAYVYTGTIGKLLLGVNVFGTETHAGAPFEGMNAAALLAAITAHLDCNHKLTQHVKGEFTPPPASLWTDARQAEYNVTTPLTGGAYFNAFFMHNTHREYFRDFVNEVRRACRMHYTALRRRYRRITAKCDYELAQRLQRPEVISFKQMVARAAERLSPEELAELMSPREDETEVRQAGLAAVERLAAALELARPTVVVSVLPPYYQSYAMALDADERATYEAVRELAREWRGRTRVQKLKTRHFYPYISDLSFLHLPGDGKITPLLENTVGGGLGLPRAELRLRMPLINLGPWGKGAHRITERVHVPFLTEDLPRMQVALLRKLTGAKLPDPD